MATTSSYTYHKKQDEIRRNSYVDDTYHVPPIENHAGFGSNTFFRPTSNGDLAVFSLKYSKCKSPICYINAFNELKRRLILTLELQRLGFFPPGLIGVFYRANGTPKKAKATIINPLDFFRAKLSDTTPKSIRFVRPEISGYSLQDELKEYMTPKKTLTIFYRIAKKLDQLHKLGFVHGDIKENNIIIDYSSNPHFIDWGRGSVITQGALMLSDPSVVYGYMQKAIMYCIERTDDSWDGYLAPELRSDSDTYKLIPAEASQDVYSFAHMLNKHFKKIIPEDANQIIADKLKELIQMALRHYPESRPKLSDFIIAMKNILSKQLENALATISEATPAAPLLPQKSEKHNCCCVIM